MATLTKNRLHNIKNPCQTDRHKVLCVCSAGLLRSPTMAVVFSQAPFEFNARAVGTNQDYALIPIDMAHVFWADEIVTVDLAITDYVENMIHRYYSEESEQTPPFEKYSLLANITSLSIPDVYDWGDPLLKQAIKEQYIESCSEHQYGAI